jgi:acetyl-CoA carboxylase carboxyl transferase subunit beta
LRPPYARHWRRGAAGTWTFDDDGSYTRIDLPKVPADPLKFRDSKRYADRLKEARAKTGQEDALVVAHGTIGGHKAVVAAMEFDFMGGSMGARWATDWSRRPGWPCCRKRR